MSGTPNVKDWKKIPQHILADALILSSLITNTFIFLKMKWLPHKSHSYIDQFAQYFHAKILSLNNHFMLIVFIAMGQM